MRIGKTLLLALLILTSICFIFSGSGVGNFEIFDNFTKNQLNNTGSINFLVMFAKYPPSLYLILSSILKYYPWQNQDLFHLDQAWKIHKMIIFASYIATYFALLHLTRSLNLEKKISSTSLGLIYFGSFAILLLSVALSFFDIIAAPFLLLSISFLFREQMKTSLAFYLIALSFNWSLVVIAPFLFLLRRNKVFIILSLLWTSLCIVYFLTSKKLSIIDSGLSVPIGFANFFNQTLVYALEGNIIKGIYGAILTFSGILILTWGLKNIFFSALKFGKLKYILLSILIITLLAIFTYLDLLMPFFVLLFLGVYIFLFKSFASQKKRDDYKTILAGMFLNLIFIFFFPGLSVGAPLWLILFSIVLYLKKQSNLNRYLLITFNVLIFINTFSFFGTIGSPPVRGEYFNAFRYIFSLAFLFFSILVVKGGTSLVTIKRFLIVFLILVNIGYIAAVGSSDTGAWAVYATTSVKANNPLAPQVSVVNGIDQRYPPLSSIIMGSFAIAQKKLTGESLDYATSTKASIFVFYVISVLVIVKFAIPRMIDTLMGWKDRLLIVLTTFSLTLEAQGLAYTNVYTIPPMLLAIVALYKKRYFLSGLLLGITISIKWQPIIILPLFGATLFHFNESIGECLKRSVYFLIGLIIPPLVFWGMVLTLPGGQVALEKSTSYLFRGAPMLSGQALNLNWIVTYILHIVEPVKTLSLEHIRYLNRSIPSDFAPVIFRGYFFMGVVFLIILRYWLWQKKNIINFTGAAMMIFFSHHIINKSAYEAHLIYAVYMMLFLFLIRPTPINRLLLSILDLMNFMNLIFFYGFTGNLWVNRLILRFDVTVAFASLYLVIYTWVIWKYMRGQLLATIG